MDFVHDQLATGRKLHVLTIVDTFSRFSPALEARFSFRGKDVVEVLERAGREVRLPAKIRVDQGTEFVSRDRCRERDFRFHTLRSKRLLAP
jgi:putative transposase